MIPREIARILAKVAAQQPLSQLENAQTIEYEGDNPNDWLTVCDDFPNMDTLTLTPLGWQMLKDYQERNCNE